MSFGLMTLPFGENDLSPYISSETLSFHYGKHHQAYVNNLNNLTEGTAWADKKLEDIIKTSEGGIFNNAAQVFNHDFYWQSLSPKGGGKPQGDLAGALEKYFGGFDNFKEQFSKSAATNFGSGWTWLVKNKKGELSILNTSNADTPIKNDELTPLITCDVWEHAYYLDYQNARPKYLESFWNLINWEFASTNL